MTDDELIERLRSTLRTHAETVSSPPGAWEDFEQQASHSLASGPERTGRDWRLPLVLATLAVAAAATALFLVQRSPARHSSTVKFANPPSTTTMPPTTIPSPTTVPSTVAPPAAVTTVPQAGPPGGPVPKGFTPVSVTFVSLRTGWVLGTAPCASPPCTSLLRTNDGGKTWVGLPAPRTPLSQGLNPGVREVRFANLLDGWAFGPELWATHDGGGHWHRITLNGVTAGSPVMALEAASGLVHAAVIDAGVVRIETSPAHQDGWTASPTTMPTGAGPVPSPQIVLQGTTGWLLENDRTVVSGARLVQGRWVPWQPPCSAAGGPATLAASSATAMVAVCDEGVWTGPAIAVRVYASNDGGTTFHQVATLTPTPSSVMLVASPSPQTIVVGVYTNQLMLKASFDGGATWKTVAHAQQPGSWADLGFTSPTQGVAVLSSTATQATLLMTLDGGQTWNPVDFRQAG
jgi:hypothetical protein